MKRIISLLLACILMLGMLPTVAAAAPVQSGGVYQIGTADDLLWFAQEVNNGNTGISGVLTADIDLRAVTSWPGIGINHVPFSGSFDGQGHTVTFDNANWGLFGFVAGTSGKNVTIQNVVTAGSVRRTPIAHDVTFTHITGCINRATVTNTTENYVGGIVGSVRYTQSGTTFSNDVLIQNCGNEASLTANDYVGGIMGSACYVNTRIEGCYNTGNIHGSAYVGGIVGWHQGYQGSNYIQNCYNTGRITGSASVAGIAGHLNNGVKVQNCYSSGPSTYAIIGSQYNTTNVISNSYFLGTASAKSVPDYSTHESLEPAYRASAKTGAEMATADFAALLGDAYKQSCPTPVLSWQTAKAHTGNVCENCKLGSTEKESYDVSFQQHDGFTLTGEDKATQGSNYSFRIAINEGYRENGLFAVKANGEVITPVSDGSYTVVNVRGPISVTVVGVEIIPGSCAISLPGAGYGYRVEGEKTVKINENYTFTISFVDGFQAGKNFKVIAEQVLTEAEIENNVTPKSVTLTGSNGQYTFKNVDDDYRILVSGVTAVSKIDPVTVNFTVTAGWNEFHSPNDSGEVMIDRELTVPYFDLSLYGLERYYYNPYCYVNEDGSIKSRQDKGTPESAYDNITVMHAFIAATELYYLGYSQKDVGTGKSYSADPEAFEEAISWSQDAGSSFMNFWDHGTNLNYYVNYEYPLAYAGWGATSDQIVMQSGDVISVHMITGQGSGSNFGFFTYNDDDGKYKPGDRNINSAEVDQGEKIKLKYFWTSTSGNYDTKFVAKPNAQLYWIKADDLTDGETNVKTSWSRFEDEETGDVEELPFGKNNMVTDSSGMITIDTAGIAPGTYYIGALGGFTEGGGTDNAGFTSAGNEAGPAFFRLTVNEYNGKIGDVNGDTQITGMDAASVMQYVAKLTTDVNEGIADVNGDGSVTGMDAAVIMQYVAKLITSFPAESAG